VVSLLNENDSPPRSLAESQLTIRKRRAVNAKGPLSRTDVLSSHYRAHAWAALVMGGEEIIPAGRSNWLQFVWLSLNKEQQRRIYEFIEGDNAREEATTFRLYVAHPSVN
jgi:hypothetical protein